MLRLREGHEDQEKVVIRKIKLYSTVSDLRGIVWLYRVLFVYRALFIPKHNVSFI